MSCLTCRYTASASDGWRAAFAAFALRTPPLACSTALSLRCSDTQRSRRVSLLLRTSGRPLSSNLPVRLTTGASCRLGWCLVQRAVRVPRHAAPDDPDVGMSDRRLVHQTPIEHDDDAVRQL